MTITTAADRPAPGFGDTPERLSLTRLGQVGRATQNALDALEQGVALRRARRATSTSEAGSSGAGRSRSCSSRPFCPFSRRPSTSSPAAAGAGSGSRPRSASYRSRLAFWLWCGALFGLFSVFGVWPDGAPRPPSMASVSWPAAGLIGLGVLAVLGWLVTRERLLPRRPVRAEEELAGHAAALLALGVVGLLVVATNPFALIFVLPSLHVWLWLPQVRARPVWTAVAVLLLGFSARRSCSGRLRPATGSASMRRGTSPGSSPSATRRCRAS